MNAEELIGRYAAGERDFIGADLRNICLMDTLLTGINLSNANLEGALVMRSFLINANLSNANLQRANLSNIYLSNSNLSNVNLIDAKLTDADLTGTQLTGADLTGADISGTKLIFTNLNKAKITDIKTSQLTLLCHTVMPDGIVENNPIKELEGQEILRRYAVGERTFEGIVLYRSDLRGANLKDVNMFCAHLSYVNLSNAMLEFSSLIGVTFINCDLRGANLAICDLTNARFIYSDLRNSKIEGSDITCTSFIEINFQGSVFQGQGQSPPSCYNVTLENGEFLKGWSNCYKESAETEQNGDFF